MFATQEQAANAPHVVHIISGLELGGAETMLYKLLSTVELSCFRHSVISLSDKGFLGGMLESLGIPVYTLQWRKNKFTLERIFVFFKLIRQLNPDLLQGWMYHGNVVSIFARIVFWKRLPVVWNIRHTPNSLKEERIGTSAIICCGALLSYLPQKIIYNSHVSEIRHKELGYSNKRHIVIPNGFNLDLFKPKPRSKIQFKRDFNFNSSSLLVGMVARFHPVKGHKLFLDAAGILKEKFPQVEFVLVGPSSQEDIDQLRIMCSENGIVECVHFLGRRSDISEIMPVLDVIVSASLGEAFPNVIGEAMACEIPCVVTDVGDCAYLVGNGGVVVKANDVGALVEGMTKVLKMDLCAKKKMGKLARQRILKNFSLQKIAEHYLCLYRDTLI